MLRLSVCLIARNEQVSLPRALRSVVSVADEIVLVDTGSTDRTVEVALDCGARVLSFAWIDDFSAAYNHCLNHAQGQWILLLDADEELLAESREELLHCMAQEDVLAYTVLRQDLVDAARPDLFTEMIHTRLFRNRPSLRYVGRIHHRFITSPEQLAQNEQKRIANSSIRLRHYGYSTGQGQAKLARAARLMELELQDRPGQFYYLVELGRTWIKMRDERGVGLLAQAAWAVKEDLQLTLNCGGALPSLLEHVLATTSLPPGFPIDWRDAQELSMRHYPKAIPLLWQIALRYFQTQRFLDCANLLERIVDLAQHGTYDKVCSFEPSILRGDALLNLGVCYAQLKRFPDARACFRRLLDVPEYVDRAKTNLAMIPRTGHR